ncbi:hypothetical protein PMSD_00840 [Paenibacillus macquariensis subsp. defensor]|nr:hypothetical protein PMSD_00840 [Paenibacillus macquariensis subsp. defensor]
MLSIINATKKKAFIMVLNIVLVIIILIGVVVAVSSPEEAIKDQSQTGATNVNDPEKVSPYLDYSKEEAPQDQSTVRLAGGIETTDGKDLAIWLIAGSSNNFGERALVKGETITWNVKSEQDRELIIGIMSVSTEKVYSELVKVGTGTVSLTIPEDGDYRIYVKNNSVSDANFRLILDRKLEGAIV